MFVIAGGDKYDFLYELAEKCTGLWNEFLKRTGSGTALVPGGSLKIKVVVHEAEEGGYRAGVPAIPGCATQGETMDELMGNVHEAIEACLDVEVDPPEHPPRTRYWKSPYEVPLRQGPCPPRRESRLATPSNSGQPPRLRQTGQRRAAFDSHPR